MDASFVGVPHVIGRYVAGRFRDQMLKQIAVGLRDANRFQRHAVFPQRRLHILEGFAHAAVFRQQVIAQRAGNGTGDTAVQRGFDQAIIFAAIAGRAQSTRHDAEIEHQRVIVGDRVKGTKLNALNRLNALFEFVQRQNARLTFRHRFGKHLRRRQVGWQAVNAEGFDIDFFIAACHLLQTHANDDALVT